MRLKHRKLREQVNSMVDISKVPESVGAGLREGGRLGLGHENLALEQGTLAGAWHTWALIKSLRLNE